MTWLQHEICLVEENTFIATRLHDSQASWLLCGAGSWLVYGTEFQHDPAGVQHEARRGTANTLFQMLEQGGLLKYVNQEAPKAIISASVYLPQEQGASHRCSQTVLVYGAQDHDTNMSLQLGKASVALTNAIGRWSPLFGVGACAI